MDVGHLRHQTEIDQTQTAILQQHPAQGMMFFLGGWGFFGGDLVETPHQTAWDSLGKRR